MCAERSRGSGFLDAARELITKRQGQTAQEIAAQLLDSGKATSYAQNPIGSFVATLHKHYPDIGAVRRKEGGAYRFYPGVWDQDGALPNNNHRVQSSGADDVRMSVNVRRSWVDLIDRAVDLGKYTGREEALQALIEKGLASQI